MTSHTKKEDVKLLMNFYREAKRDMGFFEVDKIIRVIKHDFPMVMEVSWKGYLPKYNSIITSDNFANKRGLNKLLKEYYRRFYRNLKNTRA